jgi:hypothetical protein
MADEYIVGITDGVSPDTIDFLPDLTMSDLLDGIEESNATSADIMIIGKKVTSGKKTREVGAFWRHWEDTEEIFNYLKGDYDPDRTDDSLEILQQLFGLPEQPEKVVGFIIRPT